eukprot:CAMPEP_0173132836 /NCGR_PEP_ID=MMETSP1105-20130129/376_1 /TAXON_ID=2985 /ORGANISM="Ochromonas sp., Strain BG-1" /LENGTH=429 /DNA_ID=CAMNT_0014044405 /DNA_START=135 /DNA_END=1427 /DNA_ORIENTATION=+
MSIEERKRTFEPAADIQMNNVAKRLRPEEILGGREEPGKAICRLLLNRAQFSRVIGKGGQTITHVRNATGVYMKGSDLDEENRLVLLTGTLDQVLNAFDIITELLHQAILADSAAQPMRPAGLDLSINLLLEHSKAGKVVGQKGAMMQTIKHKSGASQIRLEKEPMDISGASLRRLTIEGSLGVVRRAHLLIQEIYVEPTPMSSNPSFGGYPNPGVDNIATSPVGIPNHVRVEQPSVQMVPVPFPNLVNYGVQAETVRQLTEMKAYLWRHFSLDLSISREVVSPPGMPNTAMSRSNDSFYAPSITAGPGLQSPRGNGGRPTIESIIDARRASNPNELCFSIPKVAVGAVIGKGGQNLRELQAQYGIRVYIEKEDFNGKRMVVLSSGSDVPNDPISLERALNDCRDHIESIVDEQLKLKNDSNSDIVIPE